MATNARNSRKTTVKKYIDYLVESEDERQDRTIQIRAKQAHINHQQAVLNAENKVIEAEGELARQIRATTYDALQVINAMNRVDMAKRELSQLQQLEKELF